MAESETVKEEHVKSEARKATELGHSIKKAIEDERYDDAKKMIQEVLNNKEVPDGTKYSIVVLQEKLKRILCEQDKNEDIPNNIPISKGAKIANQSRLIKEAIQDGKYNEAKEMIQSILNDDSVSEGTKHMIRLQQKKLQKAMEETPEETLNVFADSKNEYYEMFNRNGVFFTTEDLSALETSAIVTDYCERKISKFSRSNLYSGILKVEDLKALAEENRDFLAGCIFVAEACKYFELADLGKQALKGFKRNNPDISLEEQKAISAAMSLLNEKRNYPSMGERWNTIYKELDKAKSLEEPDDSGRE